MKSSCQAGPVSQNQVRQCEHDIQFSSLFSQTSVSCFSVLKLLLDNAKNVLHFCSHGGPFVFSVFGSILPAFAELLDLRWPAIDLVLDFLSVPVADDCVFTLFKSRIAACLRGQSLLRLSAASISQ